MILRRKPFRLGGKCNFPSLMVPHPRRIFFPRPRPPVRATCRIHGAGRWRSSRPRTGCVFVWKERNGFFQGLRENWPERSPWWERLYCPNIKSLLARDPAFYAVPVAKGFDLGLAAYLLDPEDRDYSWERLVRRFGPEMETGPERPGLLALEMGRMLVSRLRAAHLLDLMQELEAPLAPVLAAMEQRGVRIDQDAFASFLDEVRREIDRLTHKIHQQAGGPL